MKLYITTASVDTRLGDEIITRHTDSFTNNNNNNNIVITLSYNAANTLLQVSLMCNMKLCCHYSF